MEKVNIYFSFHELALRNKFHFPDITFHLFENLNHVLFTNANVKYKNIISKHKYVILHIKIKDMQ